MTTTTTTRDKFLALRAELLTEIIEGEERVEAFMRALGSFTNLFLLGGPGLGKTFMGDRALLRIAGARRFATSLCRQSDLTQLAGPISIPALKEGRREHAFEGYLPAANFGTIEEIWDGNASTLIALHPLFNERTFQQGPTMIQTPLRVIICTANHTPEPGRVELEPIWDRVHQRVVVDSPTSAGQILRIMQLVVDPNPPTVMTMDDVLAGHAEVMAMPVSPEAWEAAGQIWATLHQKHAIVSSPRRMRQIMPIAQAQAWLDGATEVGVAHLEAWAHCLWEQVDQRRTVDRVIAGIASPNLHEAIELQDALVALSDLIAEGHAVDEDNTEAKERFAAQASKKTQQIGRAAEELASRTTGRTARTARDVYTGTEEAWKTVMEDLFGIGPGSYPTFAQRLKSR